MPATQLFVDSEDDNDDFEDDDGGSDGGDLEENGSLNGGDDNDDGNGVDGLSNEQQKGKKRKGTSNRSEEKRNKKLKKLGPKSVKGAKGTDKLTKEEIKELTEKEYAQYSNLYDVQLEEVLKECSISEEKKASVQAWVEEFTTFIQDLEPTKEFRLKNYRKKLKFVQLPLQSHIFSDVDTGELMDWMKKDQKLKWEPPVTVQVRGSWALDTQIEKVSHVDIFLEMPQDYLVKSDMLNHKYHVKRAIYLGYVARQLLERGEGEGAINVTFTLANGDPLKPVVRVELMEGVTVLIRAVPPKGFFRLSKLACDKNNLRYGHFFRKEKSDDDPDTSTQHYNFTILEDLLAVESNLEIGSFFSRRPKFQNAVKLIKVWLAQRGLLQGYGSFSGFIIAQFIYYLFNARKIQENMSTLQIILIFLVNLVEMDLSEKGIGFCDQSDTIKLAKFQWDVVFLDRTGTLNYTANLSKLTWKRIQGEARRALAIIDKRNVTGFLALFMTKVKFLMNFDHFIRLAPNRLEKAFREKPEHESNLLDHSGFVYPVAVSTLSTLIQTCLGERITMLDCELPEAEEWPITEQMPQYIPDFIHFGLNINREASQKLIEKCNSDNLTDIDLFKKFWGDKSELRRFKDGTLRECVALENISHFGKSRLCYQMLHYIFQKHLNYTIGENVYIDKQVENLLEPKYLMVKPNLSQVIIGPKGKAMKNSKKQPKIYIKGKLAKKKMKKFAVVEQDKVQVSADEITKKVTDSFDELSRILRELEELPLQISTVQGTSSVLRFSHVQPTPPQNFFINKELTEQDNKRKALLMKRCGDPPKKIQGKQNGTGGASHEEGDSDDDDDDDEIKVIAEVNSTSSSNLPKKLPKYVEPIGVIIHLETSGKWPDNMQAIERLKCAFLIKIGELLASKFGLTVQPYAKHLDVLKDGFVFRIKITYFRELTLLRQLWSSDGILRKRDNAESLRLEKEALILPQLTSTLHSFHLQYEAFGKTCRLAKRWVASQLLLASPLEYNRNLEEPDCRMTEECVELLVAYLFLNYAPHLSFPSESQVGLQRFLYLLVKTDFWATPIIVNFNDSWSADEVAAIELEFVKLRPTLPCIFIATPFDQKGSVWTRNLMGVLLKRLQRLAEGALCAFENHFVGQRVINDNSTLISMFTPVTRDVDVIIKLKSKMNPRNHQNLDKPYEFKEYKKKKQNDVIPVVDFDPVQMYLQELRDSFGHFAVFMHDTFGGNVIAIKWKPEVFKSAKFTTASVKARYVSKDEPNALNTNINGILEALEVMGNGIVESIKTFPDRWEM